MFNITNKTERLITTHLGDMLPPGVATAVSEVTMENPQMQEWATAGHLEVVEIQDPPDPPIITRSADGEVKDQPSPTFNTGVVTQPSTVTKGETKIESKVATKDAPTVSGGTTTKAS